MPITIGNGFLKSEILITPPKKTAESWWRILWERFKDYFFSTGRAKADSYIHEMLFTDPPPTRERLADIFFELKALACASHTDRFQVYNPHGDDSTIIFRIVDEKGGDDLLRITQSTDIFSCTIMGEIYFLMKSKPGLLKSYPQMTFTINKQYSEALKNIIPTRLCLNLADEPFLSISLHSILRLVNSQLYKTNSEWKAQEKINYLATKIRSGIENVMHTLHQTNISESTRQRAFLETMSMCGLKPIETSPPPTHVPIVKIVEMVLLENQVFKTFLENNANTRQSIQAELIEAISDNLFRDLFRTDPQAIQKMAEEQLTTLHIRWLRQGGSGLCCFL
ncbi:SPI-2 type III secretion system effector SifA [Salmonella enterica subsp. houtenae serovar 43:z4,z32:-]|nr:SPI-2 type III secretion system effector SifA [Salmonella enterica]MBA2995693.1 SPI-2 type III secretion system effector SifA [Salmonella enterica subsp. houtenae serovar 43:z4,z32:-]